MDLVSLEPRLLSNTSVLSLWEAGASCSGPQKARLLIQAGYPSASASAIDEASIGAWNLAVLRLRKIQAGNTIELVDRCPDCSETIEFKSTVNQLLSIEGECPTEPSRTLKFRKWILSHRYLRGSDLLEEAPFQSDSSEAGKHLIARSILSLENDQTPAAKSQIPNSLWEKLASSLSQYDPAAEISFNLKCPNCACDWESAFEPAEHLWLEVSAKARTLLFQSHLLASAYGWNESEIFALSDERRAAYITFVEEQAQGGTTLPRMSNAI